MKCPKCGFVSFDYLDRCKRCQIDLTEYKRKMNIGQARAAVRPPTPAPPPAERPVERPADRAVEPSAPPPPAPPRKDKPGLFSSLLKKPLGPPPEPSAAPPKEPPIVVRVRRAPEPPSAPVFAEPIVPEPAVPEPAVPEPAVPEPIAPEPIAPAPTEPEPAVPDVVPQRETPAAGRRLVDQWLETIGRKKAEDFAPPRRESVEAPPWETLPPPIPEPAPPVVEAAPPPIPEPVAPPTEAAPPPSSWTAEIIDELRADVAALDLVRPEPAVPEPAVPEPVAPEPVMPEPAMPEPLKAEPVTSIDVPLDFDADVAEPVLPEPPAPEPPAPEPPAPEPELPVLDLLEPTIPETPSTTAEFPAASVTEEASVAPVVGAIELESAIPEPEPPVLVAPGPVAPEPEAPEPRFVLDLDESPAAAETFAEPTAPAPEEEEPEPPTLELTPLASFIPETVTPEPAMPEPAVPEPAAPEPAAPEPAAPEPAAPEPAEAEPEAPEFEVAFPEPRFVIEAPTVPSEVLRAIDSEPAPVEPAPFVPAPAARREAVPGPAREPEPIEEDEDGVEYVEELVEKASFAARSAALGIDMAILAVVLAACLGIGGLLVGFHPAGAGGARLLAAARVLALPSYLLMLVLTAGYFVLFHGSSGQTIGKMIVGARVVDTRGAGLGYARAFLRYVGWLFSGTFFFLGFVWAVFDFNRQAWHDKLAHSCVIKVRAGAA